MIFLPMPTKPMPTKQAKPDSGNCETFVFDKLRVKRATKHALESETLQDVADTIKVLANPTRVRILRALALEELCVCDLAQVIELSVSATSHQLQALRRAKLVRYRMEGKLAYYCVRDSFVLALINDCVEHLASSGLSKC